MEICEMNERVLRLAKLGFARDGQDVDDNIAIEKFADIHRDIEDPKLKPRQVDKHIKFLDIPFKRHTKEVKLFIKLSYRDLMYICRTVATNIIKYKLFNISATGKIYITADKADEKSKAISEELMAYIFDIIEIPNKGIIRSTELTRIYIYDKLERRYILQAMRRQLKGKI
jgi:hypothetical protein